MNCKGFSLIESLAALAILGIALAGIVPSLMTYIDTNTLTEERSDAVAVGQQAMEALRQVNPETMPMAGTDQPTLIAIGPREYEVQRLYCSKPQYCGDASRHVVLEVRYGGETIYSLETVFTRLR